MITVFNETYLPPGALVAVGMDWKDKPRPGLSELKKFWPYQDVYVIDSIQLSHAIVFLRSAKTGQSLMAPAREAGANAVVAYRYEKIPVDASGSINWTGTIEEMKSLARAFAIPGVIIKDPATMGNSPLAGNSTKWAFAITGALALVGAGVILAYFIGGK